MTRKAKYIIIMAAALLAGACACSHSSGYNPEKCAKIAEKFAQTKQLSDIDKSDWRDLYAQYMSMSSELNDRLEPLINTEWSESKATAIDELLSSDLVKTHEKFGLYVQSLTIEDFPSARYFTAEEIAALKEMQGKTGTNILWIKGQAGLI